ncbi:hypothetical protein [Agrobacterium cavarae]|uniref:hypothetical protein n=1 Tax=Agrobacterium cavarae TaxID=2528239 RepID=UPI003FD6B7A9
MPKTIPAAGEAMPETKPATDKAVADAMRSLEGLIRELMHMAEIAADTLDDTFSPSTRISSDEDKGVTYRITKRDDDRLSFLVNNVASRCFLLNKAFEAAWDGKETA